MTNILFQTLKVESCRG